MPHIRHISIAAAGCLHDALLDRRILTARMRDHRFVIAHTDDRGHALDLADEAAGAGHPAYTVLLTNEHLEYVRTHRACHKSLNVEVLDAHREHRPAGFPARLVPSRSMFARTERGLLALYAATAGTLRRGDVFASGEVTFDGAGKSRGLTVYRALTDFRPATGTLTRHIVTGGQWPPQVFSDIADLTSTVTFGPDELVLRLPVTPGAVRDRNLAKLGLTELEPLAGVLL